LVGESAARHWIAEPRSVHEEQIEAAVVVVIEHGHTCSHRFGEIFSAVRLASCLKRIPDFAVTVGKHRQMSGLHALRQGSVQGTRGESNGKEKTGDSC